MIKNTRKLCDLECFGKNKMNNLARVQDVIVEMASSKGMEFFTRTSLKGNVEELDMMYRWFLNVFYFLYSGLMDKKALKEIFKENDENDG